MVVGTASRWLAPAQAVLPPEQSGGGEVPMGTFPDEREEILRRDVGGRRPGVVLERVAVAHRRPSASAIDFSRPPRRSHRRRRSGRRERLDGLAGDGLLNRQRLTTAVTSNIAETLGGRAGTARIAGYGRTALGSPRLHRGAGPVTAERWSRPRWAAPRPPARRRWCDEPMRWAQLVLVENDPGRVDLALLARLLPPRPRRRGLPQRRRHRRLLPHRHPLPSPQRLARHQRSVRRAGPRLPRHAA